VPAAVPISQPAGDLAPVAAAKPAIAKPIAKTPLAPVIKPQKPTFSVAPIAKPLPPKLAPLPAPSTFSSARKKRDKVLFDKP
jgi:hypothetical protein